MIRGPQVEASVQSAPGASSQAPGSVGEASATWYVQKGTNDTYWRCEAPASAVGGRVSYLLERNLDRAVTSPNKDTGIPWRMDFETPQGVISASTKTAYRDLCRGRLAFTGMTLAFPQHDGAAVWTRPCGRRAMLAQQMRAQGVLTIAETDDNYFAEKHWNLHQRQVGWGDEEMEVVCRAMCSMDRNVFSTEWLRDRYHREFRKRLGKKYLPDLLVARNCIPRADWPERNPGDGRLRVGFMGSGSHVWDVNLSYAAIKDAKQLYGAETVFIGYNPAEPDREPDEIDVDGETIQLRSEKSKRVRAYWRQVVDKHIPWIDPGEYRRAALPLDIGLCPLRVDDFTQGKSDVKAVEYTISGAAVVAWNTPVYNSAGWKNEVNCLLAGSWQEMRDQTMRLCRDPKLRFELVTAAQEMVWNERNEDVLAAEWGEALAV